MIDVGADSTQPPPFNVGNGGRGGIGWPDPKIAVPKKKTLEFENLTCSYNFETRIFTVEGPDGSMDFDANDLAELRNAMTAFGIGLVPPGSGINYR